MRLDEATSFARLNAGRRELATGALAMLAAVWGVSAACFCWSATAAAEMMIVERTRIGALDDNSSEREPLFSMAVDVACGADGELLVLDTRLRQVVELDREGQVVREFGRGGEGPGEFSLPLAIAVDSQGNRYVTDAGKIEVFDRNGLPLRTVSAPAADAPVRGIEIGPNGEMYIVMFEMWDRMMVHRLDANGRILDSFCESYGAGRTDLDLREERSFSVGQLDLSFERGILYSQLAPYSIRLYSLDGELTKNVEHQNARVKAPAQVEHNGGVRFQTKSTSRSVLWLREDGFINVVAHSGPSDDELDDEREPTSEVEFFSQDCSYLNSQVLAGILRPCDVDDEGIVWAVAYGEAGSYVAGFTIETQ